jgi:hypothetical protein
VAPQSGRRTFARNAGARRSLAEHERHRLVAEGLLQPFAGFGGALEERGLCPAEAAVLERHRFATNKLRLAFCILVCPGHDVFVKATLLESYTALVHATG